MSSKDQFVTAILSPTIAIERDPRITDEMTMRKFRIVIEDDSTGQEFAGFSGISRRRAEEIIAVIKLKGDHDLATGRLPPRKAPVLRSPARVAKDR